MGTAAKPHPPVVGIVEADRSDRAALFELLQRRGVRVVVYENAAHVLAPPEPLSCLIVGLALPDGSGLELLRKLREVGNGVPVVLIAQESDVATAVEAMHAGAVDFIEKPFSNAAVLKRVHHLLHDPPGNAAN